ncbi:putative PurR-regulated permease PerM [Natranaerovirga pectinivora]|uniref:Putative PurR-regulated permease PerM n=1 Tax=Natranaerovirga pectinivora TaxID=682400 RepID=A0A4R3MNQ5_9FIRM|nr:AI-2E family transporter [Natranaerovirga pectinivora]TCT16142.1 putative PurR-regulated permease PerM [Natranaerovirga pectinivora]
MKYKFDKHYIKISIHIIITAVILYGIIFAINNISTIFDSLKNIVSTTINLLAPLIIGLVLAYLFDPIVNFYDRNICDKLHFHLNNKKKRRVKVKKTRLAATSLTYITIIVIFIIAGYAISWNLKNTDGFRNVGNTVVIVEEFVKGFNNVAIQVQEKLSDFGLVNQGEELVDTIIRTVTSAVQAIGTQVIGFITKLGGYVISIVIGIVISFYLLMDKKYLLNGWNRSINAILPTRTSKAVRNIWKEADWILSGYVRGQLLDVLIMSVLISITLLIIGVDFAIVIGIISGFANLIPLVGSIVATIMAVLVALVGDNPMKAVYALVTLLILQQIDGNIIVPKVVGENVNLNPLMVLLAIFIFGSLFGVLGMIVAVPITALFKHFYVQYIDYRLKEKERKEKEKRKEKLT